MKRDRLLSLLLAAVMCLGLACPALASGEASGGPSGGVTTGVVNNTVIIKK